MAGKTKGGSKNKAKAKAGKAASDAAAESPDGKGCRACNFSGEVCRDCGEPHTGCDCATFAPVACKACDPATMAAAEHQPEPIEPPAGYETADQPPAQDDADDAG